MVAPEVFTNPRNQLWCSQRALLACTQWGSMGFNYGLLIGNRHARMRPPPACFTSWLCALIQRRKCCALCHEALSLIKANTRVITCKVRDA